VQVLVSEHDLELAENTLIRLKEELQHIDWDHVDVGQPEDDE
jgi:hypothetical protein